MESDVDLGCRDLKQVRLSTTSLFDPLKYLSLAFYDELSWKVQLFKIENSRLVHLSTVIGRRQE